jgi:hypothetical protein
VLALEFDFDPRFYLIGPPFPSIGNHDDSPTSPLESAAEQSERANGRPDPTR